MERKNLSDTLAEELREAILAEAWTSGQALPTEPELADMYNVSRAVVRDATRIVMAWGLVEPRQGKGVFVTESQQSGFSNALLLATRRSGGSAWDVEQIEKILLPEAAGLVASRIHEVDFSGLRSLLEKYRLALDAANVSGPGSDFEEITGDALNTFMTAFYEASGNRLLAYMGPAISGIRKSRHFDDPPGTQLVVDTEAEIAIFTRIIESAETGNPVLAKKTVADAIQVPDTVVESLKNTPAGEVPRIPMTLETFYRLQKED